MDKQNTKQISKQNPSETDGFSVIVPAYNEENTICRVIEELIKSLETKRLTFEIIVVDDGSTDNSYEILKKISGIKVIKHENNIGYGGALKTGIGYSNYNNIVTIDSDGTYPNKLIPELVKELSENDMVVGARQISDKNIPIIRKPVKWIMGKLANYLSESYIPDLNSGLRAFKKDISLKFYKILPSGFSFSTTITLAMHCNGYRIKYIPIKYQNREGKSKFSPINDTLEFLFLIFRTVMYFNPLKVFLPLAGILFLLFVAFLINDIISLSNLTDKTVFMFIAFIQILAIGLLADLIDKRSGNY